MRNNAQIISIVAHELRHPLLPIRHAAAMIGDAASDPATRLRAAEIIEREAARMNCLIGDLVDVSRMEMGALDLRRQRASLSELVERAIESARPFAKEYGHHLLVSVSPEPIYLQIDVPRICQALHNVIANACKYTDKQGHIYVRGQRDRAGVSIVVRDTGIGIPAAQLDSIFDLFARTAQDGQSPVGLGLGLYLARRFVEAHGGTLTAASKGSNRGSEFTIAMPCEASTAMVPGPAGEGPGVDRSRV